MYFSMYRSILPLSLTMLAGTAYAQAPEAPSPAPVPEPAPLAPAAPAEPAAPPPQAVAPTEAQRPPAAEPGAPTLPDTAAISSGTPEPAASAEAPAPSTPAARAVPDWLEYFSIGGGLILYYYQPTAGAGKNNVSVFFANLLLDGEWENFGLHIEPRFRDTKLRSYYDGPVWLQEAYALSAATASPLAERNLDTGLGRSPFRSATTVAA